MVTAKGEGQAASFGMSSNHSGDFLRHPTDESRSFDYAYFLICIRFYIFELMVASKLDLPAKLFDLFDQPSLNQIDWASIHPCKSLHVAD